MIARPAIFKWRQTEPGLILCAVQSRLIDLTKLAERANLANSNEPSKKTLPESETADMEFFLEQIQLLLPVIGMDFVRARPMLATQHDKAPSSTPEGAGLELQFSNKKYNYSANAIEMDGEITVLAGSQAIGQKAEFAMNSCAPLREQLIKDGRLKPLNNGDLLVFAEDVTFVSPSAAASVIANHNMNGRTAWRLKATGETLKEWQDAQVY